MDKTIQLDNLDRRILRTLQSDASLNGTALAEAVSSSPASCWRRVRALEEAGILGATVRLIDRRAVNRDVDVICSLRLKSHGEQDAEAFERFVADQENILECYTLSGEWDYLLRIVAADIRDYEQFLMHTLLRHPSVANASSQFALSRVKYTTRVPV
ncbi:Lrp/AsnC family transcriptional regulator [Pseudomonas sp. Irchel s3h14]|jgi:Lrp/AsnC family transcriptional regulator|uniref:Lrp/AsnC family transcriptional regulator n=1 Tax=Pseudomonas sp. Irchel s3h14 TaxID=2009179 RepID=UPI000BA4204B|nr:Lrp/AsnC family transcriptional regulator [Pseudomonas sp. Irchel s3h14]